MKLGYKILIIFMVLFLIILSYMGYRLISDPYYEFNQYKPNTTKTYSEASDYKIVSIEELNSKKLDEGNYNIEAYVNAINECPPCPKGAFCSPCAGDIVFLSNYGSTKTKEVYKTNYSEYKENQVMLFVKNPLQFLVDKKYKVSIKLSYKSPYKNKNAKTEEKYPLIKLLGYTQI